MRRARKSAARVFEYVSKARLTRVVEAAILEFLQGGDGVSFEIVRGATFALVGRKSGSGKTNGGSLISRSVPTSSGRGDHRTRMSMSDPGNRRRASAGAAASRMKSSNDPYASASIQRLRVDRRNCRRTDSAPSTESRDERATSRAGRRS